MKSQYHTFLKSESLKLSKLKVGDNVREDLTGKVSEVTRITSKRFAVDNGSSTQNPLNWTRLSRVGKKIYDINAKLEKLEDELEQHRHDKNLKMFRQVQQKLRDLARQSARQSGVLLWNIAKGKSEKKGGADDADLHDYLTSKEAELEFNKYGGTSDRDKIKQWLIKKEVSDPQPEISYEPGIFEPEISCEPRICEPGISCVIS